MTRPKRSHVYVRLPDEVIRVVERLAVAEHRSMANQIEKAVVEDLTRSGHWPPPPKPASRKST